MRRDLDGAAGGIAGLSGVNVASVGTSALVGEPISPPMAALLTGAGADAEDFVARQITPEVVRAADLVLTMSSVHRRQTVTLVPAAVQHTFVLGELEHMLGHVDPDDVTTLAGAGASQRRATARHRGVGQALPHTGGGPRGGHRRPVRTVQLRLRGQFRADRSGPRAVGPAADLRAAHLRVAVRGGG